jgi:hypothetical protein
VAGLRNISLINNAFENPKIFLDRLFVISENSRQQHQDYRTIIHFLFTGSPSFVGRLAQQTHWYVTSWRPFGTGLVDL